MTEEEKIKSKIYTKVKKHSTIRDSDDAEILDSIVNTLYRIYENVGEETLEDILENLVFIWSTDPAITKEWGYEDDKVTTVLNKNRIEEELAKIDRNNTEGFQDVIAHEVAHYILKNYNTKGFNSDVERQTDDLIEKWGFNRLYPIDDEKTC
jgi:hypothetical protein